MVQIGLINIPILEEIRNPQNEDRIIIVGDKIDEIYMRTILKKLITYDYIFVKCMNNSEKLVRVNNLYSTLVRYGIVRIANPARFEDTIKSAETKFEVVVFKWGIIPRIKAWRESLKDEDFIMLGVDD